MSSDPWGRVDEQGNVFVKTADGERSVGSWQAGSPDEALAYFRRKYEGLAVEVELLARRVRTTDLAPKDAHHAIERLRASIVDANAVGDLESLVKRLDALVTVVDSKREERKATRAKAQEEAQGAKERIVAEAEQLGQSTDWRPAGERLRALVDAWKAVPRLDRKADDELWHRFSQARSNFAKRRKAHFAELDGQRDSAKRVKEKLVEAAEALSASTEWTDTAARYRDLMNDWKAAGRAQRDVEEELWQRFRAAQDVFFAARSEVFAERDSEQRENQAAKEVLLAEAETILPVTDVKSARAALRSINDRWEAIGHVPRDARPKMEARLQTVERAIREAEEELWKRTNPEARARAQAAVDQIQASIDKLTQQADKARAAGNERKLREAEESIAARAEWLAEANKALEEFSG
ncbi:DUF349 domain-containing protein [Embleya sp. AB8]|uniref:DUF349 domain-containing protein n=1 Tax=Embleya sp. AB8 TaxID=3156304 RepID=UPI003C76D3F4